MKLGEIYDFVVRKGLEKDPRTKKEINQELQRVRKEYRRLKNDKKYFDKEKLKHPFTDTRILFGDKHRTVRTIMVGIDISGEELLTAYALNEKGACIDLAMSHHPSGKALANLYGVMHIHKNILHHLGIDKNVADSIMNERIEEVSRKFMAINHERSVDIARLLEIPFMCVHTPADNHVTYFLKRLFEKKKPRAVKGVMDILKSIPEYQDAMRKGAGPKLIAGAEKNKAGRIMVDMTGGTEGSKKIFSRLSQAGVGTVVGMHFSEEHYRAAKAEFMNVVVAGHIASDNLGLNLILDKLTGKYDFNIIPCSGFVRIKR